MAEEIDSLFVRLGLKQDKKEFNDAQRSFDSLKSTALQFATTVGAGLGLRELTLGFAQSVNEANKLAEVFDGLGVTPQFIAELEGAFRLIDEDASEATATIQTLADLIERTDWGQISGEAFARGFDPSEIQGARNMSDALASLNEQISSMDDPEGARRLAASLGLSDAQYRLMRNTNVGAQMGRAGQLSPLTEGQSVAAGEFQEGFNELSLAIEGVSRAISETFVGDLAGSMSEFADLLAENRDEIREFTEAAIPYLAAAATGIGTLVALRMGRAALGAFSNIPGATALAAGVGVGLYQLSKGNGDTTEERRTENNLTQLQSRLDRLNEQIGIGSDAGVSGETLQRLEEERSRVMDMIQMRSGSAAPPPETRRDPNLSFRIDNIDARGSMDPAATGRAVEQGIERAIARAAENTVRDFRSSTS